MGWTYLRFNGPLDYRHIRSINLSKERLAVSIDLTNQCRSRSLSLIMSNNTISNRVCQGISVSFSLFFSCVVNMSLLYINSCQLWYNINQYNTIKTVNPIPNHKNNLQTNLKHVFGCWDILYIPYPIPIKHIIAMIKPMSSSSVYIHSIH